MEAADKAFEKHHLAMIKKAIKEDNVAIAANRKEFPELTDLVELCPHSSATGEYIGEGDTEHTCNTCGYTWITSNPKYHE